MVIYIFVDNTLVDVLETDATQPDSNNDFGHNIIPALYPSGDVYVYDFSSNGIRGENERSAGYWRDVGTIDAFWQANIDLTDFVPKLDIYDQSWPIWTYAEIVPPAKFIHDEDGRRGMAVSSLVSGDCIVSGSEVRNSLLFTGCRTHSFSSLDHVVALPQVVVNRKAELKNCVIDRGVAMRVIFTHDVTGDAGALDVFLVPVEPQFVHPEKDAAVHGLEPVTRVRQGAGNDNAHGVVEIRAPQLVLDGYGGNVAAAGPRRRRKGVFIAVVSQGNQALNGRNRNVIREPVF